jgi:hypothetical protein
VPEDTVKRKSLVEAIEFAKPLIGQLAGGVGFLGQAIIINDGCSEILAGGINPGLTKKRLQLLEHDGPTSMRTYGTEAEADIF